MIFNTNEIQKEIIKIIQHAAKKRVMKAHRRKDSRRTKKVLSSPAKERLPKKRQSQIKNFFEAIASKKLNNSDAKMLLALLYWNSGSKFPANNFVAFSNSDYRLVKIFLDLLRCAFNINEKKIKIHLQLHPTQNIKKMIQFWSNLLHVPSHQFYKPTIVKTKHKPFRQNYFGVCAVRYYSLNLLLTITDIYQGLANKI